MADKITLQVNLGDLADFTPSEGLGSNSLMKFDGSYKGKVTKIFNKKAESGNPMLLVQLIVEDTDEKGAMLLHNVLIGGKDRHGAPLARQLGQFMIGMGFSTEQIRALSSKGTIDVDQLTVAFIGRTACFTAEAESYEGKLTSKVKNFITEQNYLDAVAASAHRKPINAAQTFSGPSQSVTTGPANVGGAGLIPGVTTNGAAKDPLAALAGLGLKI